VVRPPLSRPPRPRPNPSRHPDPRPSKLSASLGGERSNLLPTGLRYPSHAEHLERIRNAILQASDAGRRVADNLRARDDGFTVGHRLFRVGPTSRLFVVGLGKAAVAMSTAAAAALGSRIERGIVAVPRGTKLPAPERMTFISTGHPQPDAGSLACGQAVDSMLAETTADDTVLVLVSGGGSAMLEIPVPGVSLADLQHLNAVLIRSGAPIQEINIVRSALSQVKSGGLARLAAPARCVTLILSDVVGDRLGSVASGPTVLRTPSPQHASSILKRNNLWKEIPASVRDALTVDRAQPASTPRPVNLLIGNNHIVIEAARSAAIEIGFRVRVLSHQIHGEAREVGRRTAARMIRAVGPACLIMGGETTVRVRGGGRGGRNQEVALAAAIGLDGTPGVVLMAFATDGVDGPTDAAGAIVTGETATRARHANLDLDAALADNNAYPCLDLLGTLIRTGPTGTNLNDIIVGLVYRA
jgi:glycerate 2-kinase